MTRLPPSGKLARGGHFGMTAIKVGAKKLKYLSRKPFVPKHAQQQEKDRMDEESAQLIFKAFSHLRGTALKIAQLLSMDHGVLPEAYSRELSKSCYQVPPLNRAVIRKVMINQFGVPPEKLFSYFEPEAFAAASLGQVHRARTQDGRDLAIKVQYPGIGETVKHDVQLLRSLMRTLPNSKLLIEALEEIEERLNEEVDYRLEAKNTTWFSQNLCIEGLVIPQVNEQWSRDTVLALDFMQGLHPDAWVATAPSIDSRNQMAQLLFDTYIKSFFQLKTVQADSNPGNYLFQKDGGLVLLDFGCIKKLSSDFPQLIVALVHASENKDQAAILAVYQAMGMPVNSKEKAMQDFFHRTLKPLSQWVCQPFLKETFNFQQNIGFATKVMPYLRQTMVGGEFSRLNKDLVYFLRGLCGLYGLFETMGATIALRSRLPGYEMEED